VPLTFQSLHRFAENFPQEIFSIGLWPRFWAAIRPFARVRTSFFSTADVQGRPRKGHCPTGKVHLANKFFMCVTNMPEVLADAFLQSGRSTPLLLQNALLKNTTSQASNFSFSSSATFHSANDPIRSLLRRESNCPSVCWGLASLRPFKSRMVSKGLSICSLGF
jgi:hypothetical protein